MSDEWDKPMPTIGKLTPSTSEQLQMTTHERDRVVRDVDRTVHHAAGHTDPFEKCVICTARQP